MDAQFLRQRAGWFLQLAGEAIDELARAPMMILAAEYERAAFAAEEPAGRDGPTSAGRVYQD